MANSSMHGGNNDQEMVSRRAAGCKRYEDKKMERVATAKRYEENCERGQSPPGGI